MHHLLLSAIFLVLFLQGCGESKQNNSLNDLSNKTENLGIKPRAQDNFYKNINYEWLKQTNLPLDILKVSTFSQIGEEKVLAPLMRIVTSKKGAKNSRELMLQNLYQSFINTKKREQAGLKPLQPYLKLIDDVKDYKDLAIVIAKLQKIGVGTFLSVYTQIDFKDSTQYVLGFSQAGISLPKENYYSDDKRAQKQRELYKNKIAQFFKLASFDNIQKRAQNVMDIEGRLSLKQYTIVENRDLKRTYNPYTYQELSQMLSQFPLDNYIDQLKIDTSGKIIVAQPEYFQDINKIYRQISLEEWKDYTRSRVFSAFSTLLTREFELEEINFRKASGLLSVEPPLSMRGMSYVKDMLPMVMGRVYAENFFDETSKEMIKGMVDNIRSEYKSVIQNSTIFSEPTKRAALLKLEKMTFKIAYPDKWEDMSSLSIKKDDFFANALTITNFNYKKVLGRVNTKVDRSYWSYDESPFNVNAAYTPSKNSFILSAAVLNKPFFDKDASLAENYGGIGMVIAHEIGHAFDDQGKLFDENGNLNNWWSSEDEKTFARARNKLIAQANKYEALDGVYMNGNLKIGEIIGDLNGANISFAAYKNIAKKQGLKEEEYKKFFIQFAKIWKEKASKKSQSILLDMDPHPPGEFRTNSTLSNIDEFYKLFDIKAGDKMYRAPQDRVKIW